jgi:hypothetical protein
MKVVPHVKFGQGEGVIGTAGISAKSVHNDRDGRQQKISEQRIRLVVRRLSLGHESSKAPEFSAEWMVNQETQAAQEIKWGDAWRIRNGIESLADRLIGCAVNRSDFRSR